MKKIFYGHNEVALENDSSIFLVAECRNNLLSLRMNGLIIYCIHILKRLSLKANVSPTLPII